MGAGGECDVGPSANPDDDVSTLPPKPRPPLPEGPFLVVGLARSGTAVAQALAERGEEVIGCDAGHPEQAEGLAGTGVEVNLDVDGVDLVERARCVVKSPGVPNDTPVVAARARSRTVIGELEVAWRMVPNTFIAVTGTNGKTTVTELIGHIRRRAAPHRCGRKRGHPARFARGRRGSRRHRRLRVLELPARGRRRVRARVRRVPEPAPDHRDRHPTLDEYLEAKLRIFAHQGNDDVAVYNADEPALRGRDLGGCARRVAFCTEPDPDCAVSLRGGVIFWGDEPVIEAGSISLLGPHNVENAMAATAASLATGVHADAVREGLEASPAFRTVSRWSGRSTASHTSTTPRRPTSRPRRRRCVRSSAGCTRSSAGR